MDDERDRDISGGERTDVPAADATPTAPLRPTLAIRPRRGGLARWLIALAISAIVVAASAGGFALLSGGTPASTLVGYVPAGSFAYIEVRLDPPGDQHQNVANVLARFPGFADQSTLGTKLDEALDELLGRIGDGSVRFSRDIKPWLGDSMALVSTKLPASRADGAGLLLVAVTDPVAAGRWASKTLGPGTAISTYSGVSLTTISVKGRQVAFGVVGNVLLAGDTASVQAAIDTTGASTFAGSAQFGNALAAMPGDQLAFGYVDLGQFRQSIVDRLPSPGSSGSPAASADLALAALPNWLALSLRAESDGVVATIATPQTTLLPIGNGHVSTLATRLPATTIVTGELHDLAAILRSVVAGLPASSGASGATGGQGGLGQMLQSAGGLDALIGWIGDGAAAVVPDGDGLAVGVLAQAPDAATAETKLLQLRALIALLGGSSGITTRDETYHGTTITVIDAGSLAARAPGSIGNLIPGDAHLEIAVAQKDDLLVAGIGDPFVKAVLDTAPGSSLADQPIYRTALERVGPANVGQLFVDLSSVLRIAESHMAPDQRARFEVAVKPYLEPFQALASAGSTGDPSRYRIVVTVK